jgi:uncharacterized protein (TIGR01777 family)
MKQVVLITGAKGMLAKNLAKHLEKDYSIRFLTRNKTRSNEYVWDINSNYIDPNALIGVHHIIHLAGTPIATKRWTNKRKKNILTSRVNSAELILQKLKKLNINIDSFISASAIGYYGSITTEKILDENAPKGNDFLSDVCFEWENAAKAFKSKGVANRIAIIRLGIILAKNDGALPKIMKPIKYGFGSSLGNGNQYMPWIHIHDLVRLFKFILDDKTIHGTFNAVSSNYITNNVLTKIIAKKLKRPIILPNIPKFMIKLIFGEMSTILLSGSKISSQKISDAGFRFEYDNINSALNNLMEDTTV